MLFTIEVEHTCGGPARVEVYPKRSGMLHRCLNCVAGIIGG